MNRVLKKNLVAVLLLMVFLVSAMAGIAYAEEEEAINYITGSNVHLRTSREIPANNSNSLGLVQNGDQIHVYTYVSYGIGNSYDWVYGQMQSGTHYGTFGWVARQYTDYVH